MTYVPSRIADVLELDMGDGFVLYNHEADLVHSLNRTASIVWQLCEGDTTVQELASEIAEAYALDVQALEGQLAQLIAEFEALGLVHDNRPEEV
jgi:PqqD family protein of HPr-rel-A system